MPTRDNGNQSEAARESRIMELAVWDWRGKPVTWIRQQMDNCHYETLCNYRKTPLYIATIEELKEAWRDSIRKLPETADLKKQVTLGMKMALDRIIGILADEDAAAKDVIAAARLAAQLDGRFLRANDDGDGVSRDADTLAHELVTALNRQKDLVN